MAQRKGKNKYANKAAPVKKQPSKSSEAKPSSPFFKHVILFIIAGLSVLAIRKLPMNQNWENGRIKRFYEEKKQHGANLDSTYRYSRVHAGVANYVNFVATNLKNEDDLFLLPSQYYLIENAYNPSKPKRVFPLGVPQYL